MNRGLLGYPKGKRYSPQVFGSPLGIQLLNQEHKLESFGDVVSTSLSTNVVSGGSANAKGSWVELVDAAPFDCYAFQLHIGTLATGRSRWVFDIGVGNPGQEVVIFPNYMTSLSAGGPNSGNLWVPLRINKGQRIAVRCSCTTASQPGRVTLALTKASPFWPLSFKRAKEYPSLEGAGAIGTIGVDAAANTKGAWAELGRLIEPMGAFYVVQGRIATTDQSGFQDQLFDIGYGEVGAESVLVNDLSWHQTINQDWCVPQVWGPLFCDLPGGTRLTVRAQSTSANAQSSTSHVLYALTP